MTSVLSLNRQILIYSSWTPVWACLPSFFPPSFLPSFFFLNVFMELERWLSSQRVHATYTEGSLPCTNVRRPITTYNSSSGKSEASLWPPWIPEFTIGRHIYLHIIKNNERNIFEKTFFFNLACVSLHAHACHHVHIGQLWGVSSPLCLVDLRD